MPSTISPAPTPMAFVRDLRNRIQAVKAKLGFKSTAAAAPHGLSAAIIESLRGEADALEEVAGRKPAAQATSALQSTAPLPAPAAVSPPAKRRETTAEVVDRWAACRSAQRHSAAAIDPSQAARDGVFSTFASIEDPRKKVAFYKANEAVLSKPQHPRSYAPAPQNPVYPRGWAQVDLSAMTKKQKLQSHLRTLKGEDRKAFERVHWLALNDAE